MTETPDWDLSAGAVSVAGDVSVVNPTGGQLATVLQDSPVFSTATLNNDQQSAAIDMRGYQSIVLRLQASRVAEWQRVLVCWFADQALSTPTHADTFEFRGDGGWDLVVSDRARGAFLVIWAASCPHGQNYTLIRSNRPGDMQRLSGAADTPWDVTSSGMGDNLLGFYSAALAAGASSPDQYAAPGMGSCTIEAFCANAGILRYWQGSFGPGTYTRSVTLTAGGWAAVTFGLSKHQLGFRLTNSGASAATSQAIVTLVPGLA